MADPFTALVAAASYVADAIGSVFAGSSAAAAATSAAAVGFPTAAEAGIAFSAGTAATIGGINAGLIAPAALGAAAVGAGAAAASSGSGGLLSGTVLTAADALALGGSAVQAAGAKAAANNQAAAFDFNASQAEQEANQQLFAGAANARQVEQDNERRYGAVAAALAASGVDPSQGTPLDIMSDVTSQGELSRRLTLWNAQQQANATRNRATLDSQMAGQTRAAGSINAGSTLLGALVSSAARNPNSPLTKLAVKF